jgi:hypothetical protein
MFDTKLGQEAVSIFLKDKILSMDEGIEFNIIYCIFKNENMAIILICA